MMFKQFILMVAFILFKTLIILYAAVMEILIIYYAFRIYQHLTHPYLIITLITCSKSIYLDSFHNQYILYKQSFIYLMGSTLIKGNGGEENEHQTELNAILKSIGNEMNHILQNQNKNLESIRQSLNEQTNYLKTIADNIIKSPVQFSQNKLGDIQNINVEGKPIQIINQSSNVAYYQNQDIATIAKTLNSKICPQIKQSPQQNQCLQQVQKQIIEQKKTNKMNESRSQSQPYWQKLTGLNNRLSKIKLDIKNQLHSHLQKNDPILFVHKNSNQLQKINPIELIDNQDKNRTNIDYKDRFLVIPITKYEKYQKLNMMDPWISDLYERLSEEAFYGYLNKHMTKEQMKVFYSQNLILNTVKMIRYLTKKNPQISVKQILKKFGKLSGPALEFQLKKYPQKKKIFIKPQIQNMVQPCQIHEDPQYDILTNMKFRYQYQENGIYYRQIKLMINKIIKLTNQHFQSYQQEMKQIFTLQQQNIQHQIGRKINQNTPEFEEHQINSNKLKIQSPQIMRIIIKWIQELQDKINIQKFEKYIDNRYYPFPIRDGGQIHYLKQYRKRFSERFKQYLSQNKQNKLQKNLEMLQNIENQMISYIDKNSKSFTYISQNNIEVGLTTYLLSETVQQIAIKRLNQIIHTILYFQKIEQCLCNGPKQSFSEANYITFSLSDLLRSRCIGSYQKIKLVYNKLKQNTNFKIIRVKNRLTTGNRDFLLNMQFKKTPIICELQLGLIIETSNINQKQDRLGDFNHFLYQLKRAKYGPLTQAVILNGHYSQTIMFFQEKLKKLKFKKDKIQNIKPKISIDEIQIPDYEIQVQQIIFVCNNCLQVKSTKTCFLNTYKKKKPNEHQFQYLCGQCVVNTLQKSDKQKYLLEEKLDQYFQQTNYDKLLESKQRLDTDSYKIFQKNKLLKIQQSYYLIISSRRRYIVKRLDKDYFIQAFSSLITQQYLFLKTNQLDIKYVYRLSKEINGRNNIVKIHNIQQLNQRPYINQQMKEFLINNKVNWKQAICIKGKKGSWRLIDATKEQSSQDYYSNLNLFIKTKQIKQLKQSKLQYMDLGCWRLDQEFFIQNLKEVNQIKKLNLSENNLTNIDQIVKGKNILELKLNNNNLVHIDLSSLENLQKLDLSYNHIVNIEFDKLVKLQQLDLSYNGLMSMILTNKECLKLNLSNNKLVKLDISKMEKLIELYIDYNEFQQLVLENPLLEQLNIAGNKLKQFNIQKFVNLKSICMGQNRLSNLTLTNPKLQYLNIYESQLTSVNFKTLVNLNLKFFIASKNQLTQFPETEFKSLQKLDLSENKLKNINLSLYTNLRELNISNNQILQFIVCNLPLQVIRANNNKIEKVDITKLSKIRQIDFSYNKIQQIMLNNESLTDIQLYNNRIYNINVDKLNKLKRLSISNNCITSIKITKLNNPEIIRISLYNSEDYVQYFIEELLTTQQKCLYKQQKQKTKGGDEYILNKLGFYPIINIGTSQEKIIMILQNLPEQRWSSCLENLNYRNDYQVSLF